MSAHEQSCEFAERDLESRYLAGRLPEQEADGYEAHYFACDACWQRLRRALELKAGFAEGGAKTAAVTVPRFERNWWPIAAGVAAAALLLGTWRMTTHDDARFDSSMRGPDASWPVSTQVDRDVLSASWTPVPEADVYRVRLFSADGTLLMERETRDNRMEIRRDTLSQVESEQPVYWSVEALDELRTSLARSDLIATVPAEAP